MSFWLLIGTDGFGLDIAAIALFESVFSILVRHKLVLETIIFSRDFFLNRHLITLIELISVFILQILQCLLILIYSSITK